MGYDDLRCVRNLLPERLADQRVGLRIHGARRIVQDQNLWLFQQCAGNAQTLLLTARDVVTALVDHRVIPIWEFADKAICLCELTDALDLFVAGIFIAPTNVVIDCSGEQHVFLQHHRHLIAQVFQIIIAHIDAADLNTACSYVIKTRDQLHEGGLCAARTTDDTDSLARFDMQVDVLQYRIALFSAIAKVNMHKVNGPIRNLLNRIRLIGHLRDLCEHLFDTFGRRPCDHIHYKYKGYHHQGYQNLQSIRHDARQVARSHAAVHDGCAANQNGEQNDCIHHKLHDRRVQSNQTFRFGEQLKDQLRNFLEFFVLVLRAHVSLYNARCIDIFLHHIVEHIIFVKNFYEVLMGQLCDNNQCAAKDRNCAQQKYCDLPVNRGRQQ